MKTPETLIPNPDLIAYCGLYCGACRSYLKGKCPGCRENTKATWCGIRKCCEEKNYKSCAECKIIEIKECQKFNNLISKVIGFVFNSDRSACIARIEEAGYDVYAAEMAAAGKQTLKRSKN